MLIAETSTRQHTVLQETDHHAPGGIQSRNPSKGGRHTYALARGATGIGPRQILFDRFIIAQSINKFLVSYETLRSLPAVAVRSKVWVCSRLMLRWRFRIPLRAWI